MLGRPYPWAANSASVAVRSPLQSNDPRSPPAGRGGRAPPAGPGQDQPGTRIGGVQGAVLGAREGGVLGRIGARGPERAVVGLDPALVVAHAVAVATHDRAHEIGRA